MQRFRRPSRVVALVACVTLAVAAPACSKRPAAEGEAAPADRPEPGAVSAPAAAPAPAASSPSPPPTGGGAPAAAGQRQAPEILAEGDIPEVVARIDGEPVTKADLLARAVEARGALAERGTPLPRPTRAFYRQVLDDLIGNRLLHRDLLERSKGATPAEIAERMQAIRAQFPSDEAFDRALAERGFDRARLERDIAESVAVQKWVMVEVVPSVSVGEAEVRAYFDQNSERMVEPERVRARHILVRVEPEATAETKAMARRRAEEIRARLAGGADFGTVAAEASDDKASGARGGDLGWFYRGQMVPAFEQSAFELPPNRLSEIVETRFGLHLIEVIEKQAETRLVFEQVKERLEGMLEQRQLEERVRGRINELGAAAEIEIYI